jgi:hypothetical protein
MIRRVLFLIDMFHMSLLEMVSRRVSARSMILRVFASFDVAIRKLRHIDGLSILPTVSTNCAYSVITRHRNQILLVVTG